MISMNFFLIAFIFGVTIFALPGAPATAVDVVPVCEQVDFKTLLGKVVAGEHLRMVSNGFYARNPTGCFRTSIDANFQQNHPEDFRIWQQAMKDAQDDSAMGAKSLVNISDANRLLGGGQTCTDKEECLPPCMLQAYDRVCNTVPIEECHHLYKCVLKLKNL